MEPYLSGQKSIIEKDDLIGKLISVHGTKRENRGLDLIIPRSRSIKKGDVHELVIADKVTKPKGELIDNTGYIGFVEFLTSGLLEVGDLLYLRNRRIGEILGFNETHMPNHLNIIVLSQSLITGKDVNASVGNVVYFFKN